MTGVKVELIEIETNSWTISMRWKTKVPPNMRLIQALDEYEGVNYVAQYRYEVQLNVATHISTIDKVVDALMNDLIIGSTSEVRQAFEEIFGDDVVVNKQLAPTNSWGSYQPGNAAAATYYPYTTTTTTNAVTANPITVTWTSV